MNRNRHPLDAVCLLAFLLLLSEAGVSRADETPPTLHGGTWAHWEKHIKKTEAIPGRDLSAESRKNFELGTADCSKRCLPNRPKHDKCEKDVCFQELDMPLEAEITDSAAKSAAKEVGAELAVSVEAEAGAVFAKAKAGTTAKGSFTDKWG